MQTKNTSYRILKANQQVVWVRPIVHTRTSQAYGPTTDTYEAEAVRAVSYKDIIMDAVQRVGPLRSPVL